MGENNPVSKETIELFIQYRFVQYNPTSLERTYKHELLTEHDLGVTIDLINPDTYKDDMST